MAELTPPLAVANVIPFESRKPEVPQPQPPKRATRGKPTPLKKPGLVRRRKAPPVARYTVDDVKTSRHGWAFRVRESGGKRRVMLWQFVSDTEHDDIKKGNYEQFKQGLVEDWKAETLWTGRKPA